MYRLAAALFIALALAACGDASVKGKGGESVVDINQDTGPNGAPNVQANSDNGSTSGNITTNNDQEGPTCGYAAAVDADGVCKLQDHLWFTVGTNLYVGQSEFEQTAVVGCANLAVAESFAPTAADLEVGSCSMYARTGSPAPPPSVWERGPLDYGDLLVELNGEPVPLEMDENYCNQPVDNIQTALLGANVTVSATGGADIDAFEESVQLPENPQFDTSGFVGATGPITILPAGGTDDARHTLSWSAFVEETQYTVLCTYDPGEELTLPAEIVSAVRGSGARDVSVGVTRFENVRFDSADAHVNGSFTATYVVTF